MNDKFFLDTNILVYTFDDGDPGKKDRARALVAKAIAERRGRKPAAFKLRQAAFKGYGLQPHLAGVTWDQILDLSYEGRGG
jgi:hypothetical protein